MGFADKYNKQRSGYTYVYPEKDHAVYTNLKELMLSYGKDHLYTVYAFYIGTKGKYGPQASAAIGDITIVNLPGFMLEDIRQMIADDELTEAINAGEFGFKIIEKIRKSTKQKYYTVEWIDIPTAPLPF